MKVHMIHGETHYNIIYHTIKFMVHQTLNSKSKVLPRTHLRNERGGWRKWWDEMVVRWWWWIPSFSSSFFFSLACFLFSPLAFLIHRENGVVQGWWVLDRNMWPPFATKNMWLEKIVSSNKYLKWYYTFNICSTKAIDSLLVSPKCPN